PRPSLGAEQIVESGGAPLLSSPWRPSRKSDLLQSLRHDNPDLYGVIYLSEEPVAGIAEHIAHLRGLSLEDTDLDRGGVRLSLVELEVPLDSRCHDLDEPTVLTKIRLRPSEVATRNRGLTQKWAARLYRSRRSLGAIRWWSTLEASWHHVTVFDRMADRIVQLGPPERLHDEHPLVRLAAERMGIRV
ncbi:MAG TPA: RES domain-containing protein, partial [Polyangiaceae bacterium]